MQNWHVPLTSTKLHGFLGLTSYSRKFVHNYGLISKPLTQLLTTKGFAWTEQVVAFQALKDAMVSTLVLALPNDTSILHHYFVS
jgi:hypothetical protein